MNLFPAILPLALAGVIGMALALGLVYFIVGVKLDDRTDLGSVPNSPCSRMARRIAGLHVLSMHTYAIEEDRTQN
jgi:hypothetical protein